MYASVLITRWFEVQSDMRVGRCSAADAAAAATVRAAVGRTTVAFRPDDEPALAKGEMGEAGMKRTT